jgi:hypothetical protein
LSVPRQEVSASAEQRVRDVERICCSGFECVELIVEPPIRSGILPEPVVHPLADDIDHPLAKPGASPLAKRSA